MFDIVVMSGIVIMCVVVLKNRRKNENYSRTIDKK